MAKFRYRRLLGLMGTINAYGRRVKRVRDEQPAQTRSLDGGLSPIKEHDSDFTFYEPPDLSIEQQESKLYLKASIGLAGGP